MSNDLFLFLTYLLIFGTVVWLLFCVDPTSGGLLASIRRFIFEKVPGAFT